MVIKWGAAESICRGGPGAKTQERQVTETRKVRNIMIGKTPLRQVTSHLVVGVAFVAAFVAIPTPGSAAPILLPALASFAVLGATGVTNVPTSTIGGNLGSAPTPSVGGGYSFTAGSLQANTALAQQAQLDLDAAILAVNAFLPDATITDGNLDAFQITQTDGVIAPGTYAVAAATTNLVGDLFLDGGGSNSAVWVFQFSSSLITGTSSRVFVQDVGDGAGVGIYWTVGTAATLNGPLFAGNVLANTLISSDGNLTVDCGRLLSATSQVTLIQDTVSIIGCGESGGYDQGGDIGSGGEIPPNPEIPPIPEPTTMILLGSGLVGAAMRMRRRIGSGRP